MKWETAPAYLRRLIGRPHNPARFFQPAAALGPLIDICGYFAAVALALSPARAQIAGFLAAAAFDYLPRLSMQRRNHAQYGVAALLLRVSAVTLIAFFLRSGVFDLLTNGWSWPARAAIVFAAIATAALIRPGCTYCVSQAKWELGSGAGWRAGAIGVVAVSVGLRLVYSGRVELMPEEAYYWNYARHLDIGYLDHPPMVGWLIAAGTAAFGDSEFGVRIGAMCCGVIAAFFTYRLTRNLFGEPSALVAVTLAQTLPFFFLSGMLMTPDAPLTAAWTGALYFLERALVGGRREAWWGAGVCFGAGLLSKYTILLLGASALLFVVIDPRSRHWLKRFEPYCAALIALAMFSPVIVWNAQNGWISFAFQTSRRLADTPQFALHKLLASVLVLLTPVGLAAIAILLARKSPEDTKRAWRFIRVAALAPLAVFTAFSLRHEVKLDWTGAPLIAVLPALAFGSVAGGWMRRAWGPTLMVLLLLYGAGLYDLTLGLPGVGYGRHAELVPIGWRDLGGQVSAIAARLIGEGGEAPLIVGMDRYAIASELAFYSKGRIESVNGTSSGHLFGQVGLMYERWFPIAAQMGRTMLLVAWNRGDLEASDVASRVERLDPIKEGVVTRDHSVVRSYYYRLAHGYRGPQTIE